MKKSTKSNPSKFNLMPTNSAARKKTITTTTSSSGKKKVETAKPPAKSTAKPAAKSTVKAIKGAASTKPSGATTSIPSMAFATTSLNPGKAYEPGMPFRLERLISPVEVGTEYVARKKELDAEFERAEKAIKKLRPLLSRRKDCANITGTSVRFRTKFGQVVSPLQVAIVINVDRKRSLQDLKDQKLEKFEAIDGVPVKVVEGSFSLISESASFLRGLSTPITPVTFSDPIVGGAGIAPTGNPSAFGTLGLVAVSSNKKAYGISCQHVVSNSVEQIDPNGSRRIIGSIKLSRPPEKDFKRGSITESLDCSLVEFINTPNAAIKFPSIGNWIHGFAGDIYLAGRRVNSSELDKPIFKFGVGSGHHVEGRIEALNRDVIIDGVPYYNNYSVVLAEDSGRTFAIPGDSGSVLAVKANVNSQPAFVVIGILFARLDGETAVKVGIACNMNYVLHALKLEGEIPGLKIAKTWTYT